MSISAIVRPFAVLFIVLGVAAAALAIIYSLGNIDDNILSFPLSQVLLMGVFFIGVGSALWWWGRERTTPKLIEAIALLFLGVGVAGLVIPLAYAVFQIADNFLTFPLGSIFTMGVVYTAIGVILLLTLPRFAPAQLVSDLPTQAARTTSSATTPRIINMDRPRVDEQAEPAPWKVETEVIAPPVPNQLPEFPAAAEGVGFRVLDEAPVVEDDLQLIEGIGPKIAEALHNGGIHTFAELAALSPEDIVRIVHTEQHVTLIGYPATWPRQAKMLAEGDHKSFQAYVARLTGGHDRD
jgi:predicted flap endonuclease-1-like 5' DNA nuclease